MRYAVYALLGIAGFALQAGLFPQVRLFGIEIDLLAPLAAMVGFLGGPLPGMFLGMGAGLALDALFSSALGFYALPLMAVGYLAGLLRDQPFSRFVLIPPGIGAAAVLLKEALSLVLAYFLNLPFAAGYIFGAKVLPGMLVGAGVSTLLYLALSRLFKARFMRPRKTLDF